MFIDPFFQEEIMARKQGSQMPVRKPTKKISDSRRVRYGNGMAPARVSRSIDAAIADKGTVRFGNGMAPATLRK